MRKSRFQSHWILFLALALLLAACGGNTGTTPSSTPTATTSSGEAGTGPQGLPLYCPLSVAINGQDTLFVSDNDQNMVHERIIKLSSSGQELGEWHLFAPGRIGTAQGPGSAAFDAQGNMYVIDLGNSKVVKISPEGKVLTSWGSYGSGPGQFELPEAIAIDAQNTVYVGDAGNGSDRIEKFSNTGAFLGTVTLPLKSGPIGLAVDSNNDLYAANDISITKLTPTGQVVDRLQLTGNNATSYTSWTGISFDARGDFYAADVTLSRPDQSFSPHIVKIDPATGKYLAVWNVWKAGITHISNLVADSQGNVYATETTKTGTTQLQKFSPTGTVLATWQGMCSAS